MNVWIDRARGQLCVTGSIQRRKQFFLLRPRTEDTKSARLTCGGPSVPPSLFEDYPSAHLNSESPMSMLRAVYLHHV